MATSAVVSVSLHYQKLTKRVGLVQRGRNHYHLVKMQLVLAMIYPRHCSVGVKQQSLIQHLRLFYIYLLWFFFTDSTNKLCIDKYRSKR